MTPCTRPLPHFEWEFIVLTRTRKIQHFNCWRPETCGLSHCFVWQIVTSISKHRRICSFRTKSLDPEDEGSRTVRNVGNYLTPVTLKIPNGNGSSATPPSETHILRWICCAENTFDMRTVLSSVATISLFVFATIVLSCDTCVAIQLCYRHRQGPFSTLFILDCAASNDLRNMGDTFDVCVTVHHWYNNINSQLDTTITDFIDNYNQLSMFRAIISPILRSTRLCLQLVV